jgi:hypothetical protein
MMAILTSRVCSATATLDPASSQRYSCAKKVSERILYAIEATVDE